MKNLLLTTLLFLFPVTASAGILKNLELATSVQKTESVTLTDKNTIKLNTYFDSRSVAIVTQKALALDTIAPSTAPIYLVLHSGGGSISAGLELIENLRNLKRPVVTITLFSASMGFQTVQGLGERLIQSTGTLMSHKASGGFWGEFPGQLDSRYSYWKTRVAEMEKVAVNRTHKKHTLKSYRTLIENEYYCQGQYCVDQGFADGLVNASCDASLKGTTIETDSWFQEGHKITLVYTQDKCPLNTGSLDFDVVIQPIMRRGYTSQKLSQSQQLDIMNSINKRKKRVTDNLNKVIHKGY